MEDDCRDAGGRATQGAVAEVESRLEQRSRSGRFRLLICSFPLAVNGSQVTARLWRASSSPEPPSSTKYKPKPLYSLNKLNPLPSFAVKTISYYRPRTKLCSTD